MKKKYWYKFYIGECPLCGRNQSYKERQYSDKPKNFQDRISYIPLNECYDYCESY